MWAIAFFAHLEIFPDAQIIMLIGFAAIRYRDQAFGIEKSGLTTRPIYPSNSIQGRWISSM
jgi:hypothetical protein